MRPRRTHYEILGLERTASAEEVKRRYRRLAKQYHPDVAGVVDLAAAQRAFVSVAEAYAVLSDPEKRASYDRELSLAAAQRAQARPPGAGAARGNPRRPGPDAPPPPRPQPRRDLGQLFLNAQMDLSRGRLLEAAAACEEIIRRDRRHWQTYSLLGDIHRMQGRSDDAIAMYTMAIQLNPFARAEMAKLERLMRQESGAPTAPRAPMPPPLRAVAVVGWAMVLLLFALPVEYPGSPLLPDFWFLSGWTDNLLLGMVGVGLLIGFLITITGFIARLDDEFLVVPVRTGGGVVPIGVLVLLVSLLFFPLALAFYLITAVMEESASRSMVRLLGLTVTAVALFAVAAVLTAPDAALQTLLFGGNVIFLCIVLGSFVGSLFREPW